MCSFNQLLKTYGQLILKDSPEPRSSEVGQKVGRGDEKVLIIFFANNFIKDFKHAFNKTKQKAQKKYKEWFLIM